MPYLTLGSVPCDEACAQLGEEGYELRAREEIARYSRQLLKLFRDRHGRDPVCKLGPKAFQHDFGTYYELVAAFEDDAEECDAVWFEGNLPATWDSE